MCYSKPGPRCSSHAIQTLRRAVNDLKADPSEANYEVYREAIDAYHATPAGLEHLQDRIVNEAEDEQERQRLVDLHQQSTLRRARMLEAVGVSPEAMLDNHLANTIASIPSQALHFIHGTKPSESNIPDTPSDSLEVPDDISSLTSSKMKKAGKSGLEYPSEEDTFAVETGPGRQKEFTTAKGGGFENSEGFYDASVEFAVDFMTRLNQRAGERVQLQHVESDAIMSEGLPVFTPHMSEHSTHEKLQEFNGFSLRDWTPDNETHQAVMKEAVINILDQRDAAYENAGITVPTSVQIMKDIKEAKGEEFQEVEESMTAVMVGANQPDEVVEGKMTPYDQGWMYGFLDTARAVKDTSYEDPSHQPTYKDIAENQLNYWRAVINNDTQDDFEGGILDGLEGIFED